MIALLLVACGTPCEKYCSDLGTTYGGLVDGAGASVDKSSLVGVDDEGGLDEEAYAEACADAPGTTSCEECTAWYSELFLAALGTTDSCDYAYGRTANYSGGEKQCEQTCEAQGLSF